MVHTNARSSLELPTIVSATRNFDAWAWSAYVDHYHNRNVWFQRGIKKGFGAVVLGEELMPASELGGASGTTIARNSTMLLASCQSPSKQARTKACRTDGQWAEITSAITSP